MRLVSIVAMQHSEPVDITLCFIIPMQNLLLMYNYGSRVKTSAMSGHHFITLETRRFSLTSLCCPKAMT